MSDKSTSKQTAVLHLHPFAQLAQQAPPAVFSPAPDHNHEAGHVDMFLLIIEQLLARSAEKDEEIERLRRVAEDRQNELNYFHVRAIDLVVEWRATT